MLGDGGPRDAERPGEIPDRRTAEREPSEDRAPGRIGEGGEGQIEPATISNHSVTDYAHRAPRRQAPHRLGRPQGVRHAPRAVRSIREAQPMSERPTLATSAGRR